MANKDIPCHYFNNNNGNCFYEQECKFSHTYSDYCKYDGRCTTRRCFYFHEKQSFLEMRQNTNRPIQRSNWNQRQNWNWMNFTPSPQEWPTPQEWMSQEWRMPPQRWGKVMHNSSQMARSNQMKY